MLFTCAMHFYKFINTVILNNTIIVIFWPSPMAPKNSCIYTNKRFLVSISNLICPLPLSNNYNCRFYYFPKNNFSDTPKFCLFQSLFGWDLPEVSSWSQHPVLSKCQWLIDRINTLMFLFCICFVWFCHDASSIWVMNFLL